MAAVNIINERDSDSPLNENTNKLHDINGKRNDVTAHYTKEPESLTERVTFQGIGDRDSICSDDDDMPPIPDGGWGWVVVFSAFLVATCADGLAFSFGIFEEEFKKYFETTESNAALVGGFFIATPLLAGPIMSGLVDRYGCRVMTMIAGVLSTIGFILAAFSNSIPLLCLTYGVISGLAMGIFYVTAVVSVAFWFDKRRNLAVSLASCGIGVGTLAYLELTKYLVNNYGWRASIIFLACTLINMCVCGALMRNPEWVKIKQKRDRKLRKARSRRSSSGGSVSSRSLGGESMFLGAEELKALLESGKSPEYILATLASNIEQAETLEATTQANAEPAYKRMHSAVNLPTFIQQNEKVPPEVIEKLMENKRIYNIILENYPHIIHRRKSEVNLNVETPPADAATIPAQLPIEIKGSKPKPSEDQKPHKVDNIASGDDKVDADHKVVKADDVIKKKNSEDVKKDTKLINVNKDHKVKQANAAPTNWLRQISTTDHHYLRDMPLYKSTMMHRGAMLSITRYKLKTSSLPDIYRNSTWSLDTESDVEWKWYNSLWLSLRSTFDLKMYTELHFLLFNLSSLILSMWFIMPYFFLSKFLADNKVREDDTLMVGIIGIANSVGIVSLGLIGDKPWMNVTKTYAICMIICGVSLGLYPVCITNYYAVGFISILFGLTFASSYSYTATILMELMPIDKFSVAYGLILLSQGIGHLAGPPIGGWLKDITGNWDLTFYLSGINVVISGILVLVIPYTKDVRLCGRSPLYKEAADSEAKF